MKMVKVYTTSTCPYCTMLKNFLNDQEIAYEEINLQQRPDMVDYVMKSTGNLGVPQTEINGQWVIGFDPNQIMALVK
ncbi:glutaredoxin family protein [Massilibacterium senegalense]|uniref:glutaredoxin family protein n=1 Tax=Massilibacterium senegalense TaxID=1632858 RepID=UPI0007851D75|nr:glutaredoxin family protein [Massilibacterium senegalense]